MSGEYVCEQCKRSGVDFRIPADPIGVLLMKQHLHEKHANLPGGLGA